MLSWRRYTMRLPTMAIRGGDSGMCEHLRMTKDDLEALIAELRVPAPTAEWVAAASTAVTALVALAALWFAWHQVREARAARDQTRELDVKRSQPYVVAYTEDSAATNLAIDLVIKNFGPTAATSVRLELEPWPGRLDSANADPQPVGIPVFSALAPGQEWRTSWVWTPFLADRDASNPVPRRHEGHIRYRGIDDEELATPVALDLSIYTERQWVEVRTIHDAATALRDIRDNQKRWTEGLSGPLSVVTRDGNARDEAASQLREAQLNALRNRREAARRGQERTDENPDPTAESDSQQDGQRDGA